MSVTIYDYRELCDKIKELNPKAVLPPESEALQAYEGVQDLYRKLSCDKKWTPPTKADTDWLECNKLQDKISEKLAEAIQRGIIKPGKYVFPDSGADRHTELLKLQSRVNRDWDDYYASPETKLKRQAAEQERQVEALRTEVEALRTENRDIRSRLHALEQELSHT